MEQAIISNNSLQQGSSTLIQRLKAKSLSAVTTPSDSQECNEHTLEIRRCYPAAGNTTPYHSIYNTMAEVELSQNDIDLGAIASLSHLENPTLIDMKMAYGNTLAITWVKQHISLLNAASGASNRMDDLALNLCSLDIITSFPFLTLGEFCVFCARMRSLRYVQRRSDYVFSSDTIMQGIREFIRDRHEELVRYEREEKMRREREDVAMSHEQAVTTPEYLEQMKRERCAVRPATDVEEKVREFAREFRPQVMSEEEFQKRRDEQLRRMKEKYNV